jgi:hypothetical protein
MEIAPKQDKNRFKKEGSIKRNRQITQKGQRLTSGLF